MSGPIRYAPNSPPLRQEGIHQFISEELAKIRISLDSLADGNLETYHNEPDKPRDGNIVLADGTDWNPGGGQGVYVYFNNTWNKIS